jgi:hypothetical protein
VRDVTGDSRAVVSKLLTDIWSNGNAELLEDLIDPGYRSHIEEANPVRTSRQTGPIIPRTEIAAYRSEIPNLSLDVRPFSLRETQSWRSG